jgi:hypothetical protein
MALTGNLRTRISGLVLMGIFLGSAALAQTKAMDADETTIHDYVLTMDKVKAYAAFAQKAQAAAQADPALAAAMQKVNAADVSNTQKVAMMEKSPQVAAFFKASGITPHDFVFTPMTILTAGLGIAARDAKRQPPSYITAANMKFVRDHKAELDKLNLGQ